MKFVSSFSTGKDSMLALHRMVQNGHEPVALVVSYNTGAERSWFHGADPALLQTISACLDIPLICAPSDGSNYNEVFEQALRQAKQAGAEACVFGDIDLIDHRQWDEDRCRAAGLRAELPLWNESRQVLAQEVVDAGYRRLIKCVHADQLPESFLGKQLSREVFEQMRGHNIDLCGENGEYHTIVVDGPLFKTPVPYRLGQIHRLEHVSAIDLSCTDDEAQP